MVAPPVRRSCGGGCGGGMCCWARRRCCRWCWRCAPGGYGGFEVSGNDTVSTPEILQALERCGVAVGTRGVGLDQDDLRNRVLPLLPDVVYLAVNVRGCTAHVQVVERTRPPHLYRDSDCRTSWRFGTGW